MSARDYGTAEDWRDVPDNPHLQKDLGYDLLQLDVIETEEGYVFLPREEDMLRAEEFIIAEPDSVYDYVDMV